MKPHTFSTGTNAQQFNDVLTETTLFDLYLMITEPEPILIKKVEQLQDAKQLGPEPYRNLKSRLPYFIGAKYENNIRKSEALESISWLVIDLDHIIEHIGDEETLKEKLSQDKRVALMFVSPGQEGLKIVFKLKKPIENTMQFSNLYTAFAHEFARHYQLEKFVDFRTKDASRICFLSIDPKAYINENPVEVDPEKYISQFDLLHHQNNMVVENESKKELNENVYTDILKKLNPSTPKRKKIYIVPEVLRSVMQPIENRARKIGIPVVDKKDINYGQQITFAFKNTISIINLFYGKNGFSIHITNKGQSEYKFGLVCKTLIENIIYGDEMNANPINELVLKAKVHQDISKN